MRTLLATLLLGLTIVPKGLPAHHSRSHFDMDEFIEIQGVVTEVSWRSPHVYYQVTGTAAGSNREQVWTFEGHSIPGFQRMGWLRDTLELGDRILITAHPNRDESKPFAMLYSATDESGVTHYAYTIPEGAQAPGAPDRTARAPSADFAGTWRYLIPVQEAAVGSFRPPSDWPLTEAGRRQVERFDINDDPVLDCVPLGVPRLVLATYSHRWARRNGVIVIYKERSPQVRTIHLNDDASLPASYVPSELGYSTGHLLEDGSLVVETTGFSATRWGNARGLDSSEQKKVTERYALIDGGYGMAVEYTIEDPVYLTAPVTVRGDYRKSADYEFLDEPCDLDVARRHLRQ